MISNKFSKLERRYAVLERNTGHIEIYYSLMMNQKIIFFFPFLNN